MGQRRPHVDVAELLATGVRQLNAAESLRARAAQHGLGRRRTGVERRRRGYDLERRSRRVERLNRAVGEHRWVGLVELVEIIGDLVGVEAGRARHHLHRPGRGLDRDHRAGPAGRLELVRRQLLGRGVERRDDVGALALLAADLVDDRDELVLLAGQRRVLGPLEAARPLGDEAVADRVAEQRALRIATHVLVGLVLAGLRRVRDHLTVGGRDLAALDLLRLEQRPLVLGLRLEVGGVEDRPVAREPDEQREQDEDDGEQAADRDVHRAASGSGRRARSEISSSSATRTMLAITELPP